MNSKSPRIKKEFILEYIPALVITVAFVLFFFGFEKFIDSRRTSLHERAKSKLVEFTNFGIFNMEKTLQLYEGVCSGAVGSIVSHSGNMEKLEIEELLPNLFKVIPACRNFAISKGSVIRYVYPVEENKSVLGFDISTNEEQNKDFTTMKMTGKSLVCGPVNLVQGGKGLIFRKPIYIQNKFWGFVSIVTDFDGFIETNFGDQLGEEFFLSVKSSNGEPFYSSHSEWKNNPKHTSQFELKGTSWRLCTDLKQDKQAYISLILFSWVGRIILTLLFVFILLSLKSLFFWHKGKEHRLSLKAKEAAYIMISQDIKKPLSGLLDRIKDLNNGFHLYPKVKQEAELLQMNLEGNRTKHIIDNFHIWTKIQANLVSFEPKPTNLNSAIQKAVEENAILFKEKGIEPTVSCPQEAEVFSDGVMLHYILSNLINNSLEHGKATSFDIDAYYSSDKHIVVLVKDTGIGMAPDLQENLNNNGTVFQATKEKNGSGIGLAICKHLLNLHNSQLYIVSSVENGTTVSFTLKATNDVSIKNTIKSLSEMDEKFGGV